jgi:L-threonylcarbamoyladenylate synthase
VSSLDDVARAVREGELVVIPTDTVYGLACKPDNEAAVRALSVLKRRLPDQPIALVGASIEALRELVPELASRSLPRGPFTFVLSNPARRLSWLSGSRPETIGVRVPEVRGPAAALLARVGVVAATSANLHGMPDPRSVAELSTEILEGVGAVFDGGELPGTPSTVIDLTGAEPRVLREGAVPAAEALARVAE